MASNINYLSINENFPVAGQDNDTQVFRDNFDTIKTSFRNAQEEITDLQTNSARTDVDNIFNQKKIQNAVLQEVRETKYPGDIFVSNAGIDWENGSYQTWLISGNVNMDFRNFPGDPNKDSTPVNTVGRMTLELKASGSGGIITFTTSGGTVIKKDSSFPGVLTIDDVDDPVFIEVWRHDTNFIYMRYLGKFTA